jgi:hypothetical protein
MILILQRVSFLFLSTNSWLNLEHIFILYRKRKSIDLYLPEHFIINIYLLKIIALFIIRSNELFIPLSIILTGAVRVVFC